MAPPRRKEGVAHAFAAATVVKAAAVAAVLVGLLAGLHAARRLPNGEMVMASVASEEGIHFLRVEWGMALRTSQMR